MARAEAAGVVVISTLPAGAVLGAADAALAASGTVTLECAAARVPPVIFFRPGPLSALVARAFVRVPHVGLPNLVLGERAFPEFVGRRLDEQALTGAVLDTLGRRNELRARCDRVRSALEPASRVTPSESVARLLAPWIEP
jgi:lipid-A-disaccharide synthase